MSKFFKKHIYGEKREDFSSQSLPRNRKVLFSYLIKTRLLRLIYINLITFLFFVPLFTWIIITRTYEQSFGDFYREEVFQSYLHFVIYVKSPLMIVSYVVAFTGLSGAFYVIRMMSWNMPINIWRSFFKGIHHSWRHFIIYGLGVGLYLVMFDIAYLMIFVGQYPIHITIFLLSFLLLSLLLIFSVLMFTITLSATYNIKLVNAFKSSFKLMIRYFVKSIGVLLLSLSPLVVWFVLGTIWFPLIGTVFAMVFGITYAVLIIHLYTNSLYDVHINKEQYEHFYRKGLAPLIGMDQ